MKDSLRLTRAELREVDRLATEECGIPSSVLMENAGRGAAECVLGLWLEPSRIAAALAGGGADGDARSADPRSARRIAILCGAGNNGGDGAVVARHLSNAGLLVDVFATESRAALRGDAALQRLILERMMIRVHDISSAAGLEATAAVLASADVLVDALLGTGFEGEVRPKLARVIERINALRSAGGRTVVALDLPSGLDCDSGVAARPTVTADLTVTFVARKAGFDAPAARAVLGVVHVATIGAPAEAIERARSKHELR
jgi:NAD(P)H-hydrate epimerase